MRPAVPSPVNEPVSRASKGASGPTKRTGVLADPEALRGPGECTVSLGTAAG